MAEVLERTYVFDNPEKAREAGLRSAEIRRAQLIERAAKYQEAKQAKEPTVVELEIQQQLELTEEQIAHTRALLNDDKACYCAECERGGIDGKERAALLRELRGLCELRLDLRGISRPGQTKPSAAPRQSRQHWPEPTPLPAPIPPVVVEQPKPEPGQQQAT
jgi:hypothetical protein